MPSFPTSLSTPASTPAITLYGIPNCDQVKKARQWLELEKTPYLFHDFKKAGLSQKLLETWLKQCRWEDLINRKGTTWRKLEAAAQPHDRASAIALMLAQSSVIKRPVLTLDTIFEIGFSPERYAQILTQNKAMAP